MSAREMVDKVACLMSATVAVTPLFASISAAAKAWLTMVPYATNATSLPPLRTIPLPICTPTGTKGSVSNMIHRQYDRAPSAFQCSLLHRLKVLHSTLSAVGIASQPQHCISHPLGAGQCRGRESGPHLPWRALVILSHAILLEVNADAVSTREAEAGGLVIDGNGSRHSIAQLRLVGRLHTAPLSRTYDQLELILLCCCQAQHLQAHIFPALFGFQTGCHHCMTEKPTPSK